MEEEGSHIAGEKWLDFDIKEEETSREKCDQSGNNVIRGRRKVICFSG